jgi:hypothetical protein
VHFKDEEQNLVFKVGTTMYLSSWQSTWQAVLAREKQMKKQKEGSCRDSNAGPLAFLKY